MMSETFMCILVTTIVIFILLGMAVLFAAIFFFARSKEKKRIAKLKNLADETGMTYSREDETGILEKEGILNFKDFQRGFSRKATNLLMGKLQGEDWLIFDYHFSTPGGPRNTNHHIHSVFLFKTEKEPPENLPGYNVRSNDEFVVFWKRGGRTKPENMLETVESLNEAMGD